MMPQLSMFEYLLLFLCVKCIDGDMTYTSYNELDRNTNGVFKCNAFTRLKCVASTKPSFIRWLIAETVLANTPPSAVCFSTSCNILNNFTGRYMFEYDEAFNSSTLSISFVSLNETVLQYICDDGINMNHFVPKVKVFPNESLSHIELTMDVAVKELIVTTDCTLLENNVTFTWFKTKTRDGSVRTRLNSSFYTTNDTYCYSDRNCGGHGLSSAYRFSEETNGALFYIMCVINIPDSESAGSFAKIYTEKQFKLYDGSGCSDRWPYIITIVLYVMGYIICFGIKFGSERTCEIGIKHKLCTAKALVWNFIMWKALAIIWDIIAICLVKAEKVCMETCCSLEFWKILLIILGVTVILVFIEWYLIEPVRDLGEDNQGQDKNYALIKWKMFFNNKKFTISYKKSNDQIWGKELTVPSQKQKDGFFLFYIYDVVPNTAYDVKVMYRLCKACPVISSATTSFTFNCGFLVRHTKKEDANNIREGQQTELRTGFETNPSERTIAHTEKANINRLRLDPITPADGSIDKNISPKKKEKNKRSTRKNRKESIDASRKKAGDIEETDKQEKRQTYDTEDYSTTQHQYYTGIQIIADDIIS